MVYFRATNLGIVGSPKVGIAIFGPAFKDQERQKLEKERNELEAAQGPAPAEVHALEEPATAVGSVSQELPATTPQGQSKSPMTSFQEHPKDE
ncbi:hypothetical protein MMC24_007166 [Lignoscripta atroalba]|nr:hypothetical protein [Lignoscripta atroalba]